MNTDKILFQKWKSRIPKGWYGFDSIPEEWEQEINDFLIEVEEDCPDFEIHQIKLKFGRVRIYLELNSQDKNKINKIEEKIDALENKLYSPDLIY